MVLHFRGGKTSDDLSIIKETKKYIVFRCHSNHNVIKGMWLEL